MNPREKFLVALTAGLLASGALWLTVRWGIVARWEALNQKIARERARIVRLQTALQDARGAEQRWKDLKPLSNNPHRAEQRFRQDLSEMLEQHGLREDFTVRTLPQRRLRSNFTEVRLAVQARGTLQQFVNFLCDFYRRGYLARIDQISLAADDVLARASGTAASRSRPGRRGTPGTPAAGPSSTTLTIGPEGPQLTISFSASALVLPLISGVESEPHPDPLAPPPEQWGRLSRPPEEYALIWQKNFFRPYQEPPRVATTQPTTAPARVVETSTPTPPPPPPPRPRKSVAAVSARDGRLEVGIRDLDRRENPLEWYGINDPIDDGTLVLVDRRGIVVAVEENHGGQTEYVYYFYRLGSSFDQRERLDPEQYPEIHARLQEALEG